MSTGPDLAPKHLVDVGPYWLRLPCYYNSLRSLNGPDDLAPCRTDLLAPHTRTTTQPRSRLLCPNWSLSLECTLSVHSTFVHFALYRAVFSFLVEKLFILVGP